VTTRGCLLFFSSLQCVSSHPNSRWSAPPQFLLTADGVRVQTTPTVYSMMVPERHPVLQQFQPQGNTVIDLTESGENWFDLIGSCHVIKTSLVVHVYNLRPMNPIPAKPAMVSFKNKLVLHSYSRNSEPFMKPEGSLLCSQIYGVRTGQNGPSTCG
jgi:hypothetical protein